MDNIKKKKKEKILRKKSEENVREVKERNEEKNDLWTKLGNFVKDSVDCCLE